MGALNEVELVEGDAPEAGDPQVRGSRRRWWWAAGAIVVVAGLVVGGQAVLDARNRAHLARFDDVPGVLLPLGAGQLGVAWERTSSLKETGLGDAVEVEGRLVGGSVSKGRYSIAATDRATGKALWTVAGALDSPDETADSDAAGIVSPTACQPLGSAALVACALGQIGPQWLPAEPLATRILVIDATDGTVVSSRRAPIRAWAAIDGTVVTATSATDDGKMTWTLESFDADGAHRWTRALDPVWVMKDTGDQPTYDTGLSAGRHRIALTSQGHLWVLEGRDVVQDRRVETRHTVGLQRGVVMSYPFANEDGSDSSQPIGYVSRDGHWQPLVGAPVWASVDDGSADDVILSADDIVDTGTKAALVAHDATTGDLLWSRPAELVSSAVILDGTVYVVIAPRADGDAQSVVALDATTGTERWSRTLPRGTVGDTSPATDGRAVYAIGGGKVRAFDLDDGSPRATITLPDTLAPSSSIAANQGLLVASRYDDGTEKRHVQVLG